MFVWVPTLMEAQQIGGAGPATHVPGTPWSQITKIPFFFVLGACLSLTQILPTGFCKRYLVLKEWCSAPHNVRLVLNVGSLSSFESTKPASQKRIN